ncbi:phosphotransferase [Methylobacterium sp. JK268]
MASDGLWLVTSSAFVDQELSAEFGHLPPAFLPVGTKRLYEYQLEQLGRGRQVYYTLPESYVVPPEDERRLSEAGATVLTVPDGLSLGDAVVFALNLIGGPEQPVRILHGDTLVTGLPTGLDEVGVATSEEGYSWAEVRLEGDRVLGLQTFAAGLPVSHPRLVACGYFAFARSSALVRAIVRARGSFVEGIEAYAREGGLRAVDVPNWLDFGHLQTFFRSRRLLASARAFNTLRIDGRTVRKLSADTEKMVAEASWFASLPPALRVYTARLIDSGEENGTAFYETEYEHLPTLSELFVFGTLGRATWLRVLQSCHEFLATCANAQGPGPAGAALRQLATVKTADRLRRFSDETGFDIHHMLRYDGHPMPSLMQIAEDLETGIDLGGGRRQTVMHGDFCFSNVLYSSRVQRIKVIDPRGYVEAGEHSIYGDTRYDLAKMCHSIVGRYDQIIAGRYAMPAEDNGRFSITFEAAPHHAWLEEAWREFEVGGVSGGSDPGDHGRAVPVDAAAPRRPSGPAAGLHRQRPAPLCRARHRPRARGPVRRRRRTEFLAGGPL